VKRQVIPADELKTEEALNKERQWRY